MPKLAPVFSHHMVLQRNQPIAVWGSAANGTVTVTLNGSTASTEAENGAFFLRLPPQPAGGPYTLTATDASGSVTFTDVMVGEVWLAGGQSNMELELHTAKDGEALLKTLTPDLPVRYYYTPKERMVDEKLIAAEANTGWNTASPEGSRAWSAVGFYFARILAERLGVTVGILGCNWGGTSATAWMSRAQIAKCTELQPYLDDYEKAMAGKTTAQHIREYDAYQEYSAGWNQRMSDFYAKKPDATWAEVIENCGENQYPGPMGPKNEYRPGGLYETMLRRICPYTLAGVLYYQGESDDHRPAVYERLLRELILQWREDWHNEKLPFLLVQLPMFAYAGGERETHWCKIREAQQRVCDTVKNTELAVILDCGELDNIHPTDKYPVGERLARLALKRYHLPTDGCADAPMYDDSFIDNDKIQILLRNAADGLTCAGTPTGFEIAGADKHFYPAEAVFAENRITLSAPDVPQPRFARYAWVNYGAVCVFGKNGIPLSPFRTARTDEA